VNTAIFSTQKIYTCLFNQLERTAVLKYGLTTLQLKNLSQNRKDFLFADVHTNLIQQAISDNYKSVKEIKNAFKILAKEKQTVDPQVKLPSMKLPFDLASEEDKQTAIEEGIKNLESLKDGTTKKITLLEKEINNLKTLKGAAASKAKETIKTKDKELTTLKSRLENLELTKIQIESISKEDIKKLHFVLTKSKIITVPPRAIHINNLPPSYLKVFEGMLQELEAQLVKLTQKGNNSKQNKVVLHEKFAQPLLGFV